MCGIAGIFDETHQIENQKVIFEKMIQSMKHRGPNDDGIYLNEHVALLHTRLAIVDIENGKQPMKIGHYVIIYNGECYNTQDLRNDLIDKGYRLSTKSDTEVILMLYIHYKEECLKMINGIFSFVIYDEINLSLFLARDSLGVKPLFYTIIDKIFIFASEIKTLLTYPLVKPIIDKNSIHQLAYLGPGRIEGFGIFKNIFELKGGEYAIYDSNGLKKKRYYSLKSVLHRDNYDETIEKVKELTVNAIERQLVSDVNIGCFLSGGLDSSIIVSVASKYFEKKNQQLKTFSLEFEDNKEHFIPSNLQPTMDSPYIDLMMNTFNTQHHIIKLKNSDLIDMIYKSVDARDLPGMGDIDTSLLCFCKEVKKHVDVVLSGECADEIFGGYPWFKDKNITTFPWSKNIELRNSLLNKEYQINAHEYIQELYNHTINETSVHDYDLLNDIRHKQMINLNIHWFMQTLLERKDRMSMANGLEARVPFCDIHLLNYIYSIPQSYKTVNPMEKGILRDAMIDYLPVEIFTRKKNPFPKTHNPLYLKILTIEFMKLDENEPLWKIFNQQALHNFIQNEQTIPWYGQLMTKPQTIAYFLQINYWLKKYKIQIQ